jgi:hypothetical protein
MTPDQAEQILALAEHDDTLRDAVAELSDHYDDGEPGDAVFVAALIAGIALFSEAPYFDAATVAAIKSILNKQKDSTYA